MASPSGKHSRSGIERFLRDLRSYGDRRESQDRRGDRRSSRAERRSGGDRRAGDRRGQVYGEYTLRDAADIQLMVLDPTAPAACPGCDGNLMLGPPIKRQGISARRVQCTGCHRLAFVRADL